MKKYIQPEINEEIIELEDVIAASGDVTDGGNTSIASITGDSAESILGLK